MQDKIRMILLVFEEEAPPAMAALCSKPWLLFCIDFDPPQLNLSSSGF